MLGARVDMDVAGPQAQRLEDDRVDQANRRRLLRTAQQLLQALAGTFVVEDDLDAFIGVAAADHGRQVFQPVRLAEQFAQLGLHLLQVAQQGVDAEAGHEAQFVDKALVQRVGHGQAQALVQHPQRQHQLASADALRHQGQQRRIDLELAQVDFLEHQVRAQQLVDLLAVEPVVLHELPQHRGLVRLHFLVQLLDLLGVEQALLVQQDGQLATVGHAQLGQGLQVAVLLLVLLLQGPVALLQRVLLKRQGNGQAQVVVVPGLEDEAVDGPILDRAHHRFSVGVPGKHDADGIGPALAHPHQQLAAIHLRHHEVADNQLDVLAGEYLQRLDAVAGEVQLVVLALEHPPQRGQDARFIIHQQQLVRRGGPGILGLPCGRLTEKQRCVVLGHYSSLPAQKAQGHARSGA
ncbi:hypothetical protein D9M68_539920 [compost metagenome]